MNGQTQKVKQELLANGTRIFTSSRHRIGTDSILLLRFSPLHRLWRVLDLGSGCGILLLGLADRGFAGSGVGIEQDEEGARLLQCGIEENHLPLLKAVHGDLRDYRGTQLFDLVLANPPYFNAGPPSPDPVRALARHEGGCNIEDICHAAANNLKEHGCFCMCYPPARLGTLFSSLLAQNLAPKRLQLVRKTPQAEPFLALVDARLAGGEGLQVLPDILMPPGKKVNFS